ncbi:fibroblast growth factor-binding protein 3 [Ambystoma mexicanum]|uniref:fibroblast growth factor-binding protein 3 n=1 Tax=Ambystoma mexicanum TaxID=8296 RepID=UPI0037E97DDC
MRLSSTLPLILLCCLSTLQGVAPKNEKPAQKKDGAPSFARSGHFSTKESHECTWKITGDQAVNLAVSCTQQQNQSYECAYQGEPQRCPAYNTKAKQYWKQILGKMKKKRNPCEDKSLKSRICKKGPTADSQLRLVQKTPGSLEGGKVKGKGRRVAWTEKAQQPGHSDVSVNMSPGSERKGKAGKQESSQISDRVADMPAPVPTQDLQATGREDLDEISELNADLAKEYCAENLQSVCSFFVNFWNG